MKGMEKEVAKKEKELEKLRASSAADSVFDLGVTEEEFAEIKSDSDRPIPGTYLAELGMVDVDYSPAAIQFPFTIVEPGKWNGFTDAFYSGKSKESAFKVKNICSAAGLEPITTAKGTKAYDFNQVPGKKIRVVYVGEQGTFTGNDGVERQVVVSKAKKALPA
jgi:hypothetical protein